MPFIRTATQLPVILKIATSRVDIAMLAIWNCISVSCDVHRRKQYLARLHGVTTINYYVITAVQI